MEPIRRVYIAEDAVIHIAVTPAGHKPVSVVDDHGRIRTPGLGLGGSVGLSLGLGLGGGGGCASPGSPSAPILRLPPLPALWLALHAGLRRSGAHHLCPLMRQTIGVELDIGRRGHIDLRIHLAGLLACGCHAFINERSGFPARFGQG